MGVTGTKSAKSTECGQSLLPRTGIIASTLISATWSNRCAGARQFPPRAKAKGDETRQQRLADGQAVEHDLPTNHPTGHLPGTLSANASTSFRRELATKLINATRAVHSAVEISMRIGKEADGLDHSVSPTVPLSETACSRPSLPGII